MHSFFPPGEQFISAVYLRGICLSVYAQICPNCIWNVDCLYVLRSVHKQFCRTMKKKKEDIFNKLAHPNSFTSRTYDELTENACIYDT